MHQLSQPHVTSLWYRVSRIAGFRRGTGTSSIQLHHLVTCALKLHACLLESRPWTLISPNTSAPAFLPLLFSTLLLDDDTCICTCYLRTNIPSRESIPASSLTQSGAFTNDLYTQSHKTTAIGFHKTHSPTINPGSYHLPHNPTNC